jgi:methyl-accepting chemotaxis protein
MGLLDIPLTALRPLRAMLNAVQDQAEETVPGVEEIEGIQTKVLDTVEAIQDATEQIEAHVAVLETLATSIDPLTQAVEKLVAEMAVISAALAPLAAAEHGAAEAEHDLARISHLFGRRRSDAKRQGPSGAEPGPQTPA